MANVLKIKRRTSGVAGSPSALASGEVAFNEAAADLNLYYGAGDNGSGQATSIIVIGGPGAYVDRTSAQTIAGVKTFSSSPVVPTPTLTDSSTNAASTAFVQGQFPATTAGTYPKVTVSAKGLVTAGAALAAADLPVHTTALLSDFTSAVTAFRLDQFAAATSPISGIDPTQPAHLATKNYVDNAVQGLDAKQSVQYATNGALPTNTRSGNVLTASANGALTVDGGSPAAGARILVKDESAQANNGFYVVANAGSASAPFVLTRSADMDTWAEVPGSFTFVEQGTVNSDTGWVCSADQGGTLNSTAITFIQFNSAGTITAGNGLTKTGNALSVLADTGISVSASGVRISATYAGQTSITTLGTIGTGIWQGTAVALAYGGTGANLTALSDGAILKKVGTAIVQAVAGTDYLNTNSSIDGGSF